MLSAPITKNQIDPWCLRYHRSHPDQNLCYLASLDSLGTTDDEMRVTSARHIEQLNSVMDGISCCPLADFPLGNAEPSPAISTCLRCLPFHGPANTVSFVIFVEHLTLLPWYNTSTDFWFPDITLRYPHENIGYLLHQRVLDFSRSKVVHKQLAILRVVAQFWSMLFWSFFANTDAVWSRCMVQLVVLFRVLPNDRY